jgi:hypothetical protein
MNVLTAAAVTASVMAGSQYANLPVKDSDYALTLPSSLDALGPQVVLKPVQKQMHEVDFNWRSQRQKRKNARRQFAAGNLKAFDK